MRVALEVVVAGLGVAGDGHVAHDRQRPVGLAHHAGEPKQVGLREHEAVHAVAVLAADAAVCPPQHQAPAAEIDGGVAELLAEQFGIVGHFHVVAVVVAADVEARDVDRAERFGHLAGEHEIAVPVAVGDAVAQIDHRIRPRLRHEAAELGQKGQRGAAQLGHVVAAVVDIRHHGNTHGHHQLALNISLPARKSST